MDRLSDEPLASAVLAQDKHSKLRGRNALDRLRNRCMTGLSPIHCTRDAACVAIWLRLRTSCSCCCEFPMAIDACAASSTSAS